jgi:hypothetical protein
VVAAPARAPAPPQAGIGVEVVLGVVVLMVFVSFVSHWELL